MSVKKALTQKVEHGVLQLDPNTVVCFSINQYELAKLIETSNYGNELSAAGFFGGLCATSVATLITASLSDAATIGFVSCAVVSCILFLVFLFMANSKRVDHNKIRVALNSKVPQEVKDELGRLL